MTSLLGAQERKIAAIDFFGGEGGEAVRRALPVREGDVAMESRFADWREEVRKSVLAVTGKESTDQAFVCCYDGHWVLYVGLAGGSTVPLTYKAAPAGPERLSREFIRMDERFARAWERSVKTGRKDELDAVWRQMWQMAARHERALLTVAVGSSDARHRAAAAFAIGHAMEPTSSRLAALVDAANDLDGTVRNNAVRGLAEWAQRHQEWRTKIPAEIGIRLVRSGTWSDRNKGMFLLQGLTESRDEAVLAMIRAEALPALREMAAWRWPGHNGMARLLLGRVAGVE